MSNQQKSTLYFLIEVRRRLIYALLALFSVFALLLFYSNRLYTILAAPLVKFLPHGHLIATGIVSPFFVPFKLAFIVSLFISMPFFLFQIWRFISPALYPDEKKLVWPFMFVTLSLFYLGILFAYFAIFPALFHFLSGTTPQNVVLSPDISEYMDFTTKLLFIFGLLFEIPMVMVGLVWFKVVERAWFIKMRSYAIVGAFILGMLLAPPDVFSQTLIAIPIWFLYETGIFLAKFTPKQRINM